MASTLFIITALGAAVALSVCQACLEKDSVIVATSPVDVQLTDYKYNDDTQDYEKTASIQFSQPVPDMWQTLRVSLNPGSPKTATSPGTTASFCLNTLTLRDPCHGPPDSSYSFFKVFYTSCFDYYREGLYKVTATNEYDSGNSGDSGSCDFDGTSSTWTVTKIDSQKDALNWTVVVDREVQNCGEPVRRYSRVETVIYKVTRGCVLHAKAQDCKPGVATCQPCTSDQVETVEDGWFNTCVNKTYNCNASVAGFMGCPVGFQVGKEGFPAKEGSGGFVTCEPCPPNQYQDSYPSDSANGFRFKCQPCPDYQEVKYWGSDRCDGCSPGYYPKNKIAPLQCTKCPPGTFSSANSKRCTQCTGGFYADQPGMPTCKKCPTEWRCLVPNKVLGKFSTTPYRWDESGNPACPTLDGKSCWKSNPDSCRSKLQMMKEMIANGTQIKALVCGPMHKKIWGFDGYNDSGHWCSITKTLFMQPGKKDVGATSCNASANMVAALPETVTESGKCECCDVCQAG